MQNVRARKEGERLIYIHNDLANAALYFKDRLDEKVKGGIPDALSFDCMAVLIMLAFTFEAYINFFGDRLIDGWKEKARFDEKVDRVFAHLKMIKDDTTRPYSSIVMLKTFRDMLAHGKPIKQKFSEIIEGKVDELNRRIDLTGGWEQYCNAAAASEAYDDVEILWRELLEKSGLSIYDTMDQADASITIIEQVAEADAADR